jgi:hypothetical protein
VPGETIQRAANFLMLRARWAPWSLVRVLERTTLLIGSHFNTTDVYRIVNLEDEQVADFSNRFRFLFSRLHTRESAAPNGPRGRPCPGAAPQPPDPSVR